MEQHRITIACELRRKRSGPSTSSEKRGRRVRHLAAEGAYRKATLSMRSEIMNMSPEEDLKCARDLIPSSAQLGRALSSPTMARAAVSEAQRSDDNDGDEVSAPRKADRPRSQRLQARTSQRNASNLLAACCTDAARKLATNT